MAEFEPCVVPFPLQRSPLHESERFQPADLRIRIAAYSALDLLDEMVVLYRRALSEVRGGAR